MEVSENKGLVYEFGKFVLNPKERTLFIDGEAIHLPAKEFDTLVMLVEHNGRALSKEEMLAAIWQDAYVEESNLAKQISRLRKLFSSKGEQFIETLPKHGYRFRAELRRTLVETEDAVILEKRTVRRVTFAVENEEEPTPLALPPARRSVLTVRNVALLLIAILGLACVVWYFRGGSPSTAAEIDPYAPIRITDNPNDDTWPQWTRDGRIRFARIYPDGRVDDFIMNADGTGQSELKFENGRRGVSWSPDEQKMIYQKQRDRTKTYLANADGSGEVLLTFHYGRWSPDSKLLAYHQRIAADNSDIFLYSVETGESRNITNNKSTDADPAFSPDGKQIVFVSTRDGNDEIYLVNLDGTNLKRLTFHPANDAHPAFSPDGTQILFGSVRENENGDAYVMNPDGSNIQKITNWDKSNETTEPGSWSPDGTKIAFYSDRNGKDDIYVVSAETFRPNLVLSDADRHLGMTSYSPDGKRVVYTRETEDKSGELRVLDLQTQQSTLVQKTELPGVAADWSPDGNWITFSDRVNGNSEILVVRSDGTQLRNLTNEAAADYSPAWSPDGKRILFTSGRGVPSGPQLYIMNADGSDPHPVTPKKGWEGNASWSPDGSLILFECDREDSPGNMLDICQIKPDGTEEKRVLFHRGHDSAPVVSPDGKRIAFTAASDSSHEIYLVNSDGSGLLRLTRSPADDLRPRWSPDGKKLIFLSNRSGKFAIYEIQL